MSREGLYEKEHDKEGENQRLIRKLALVNTSPWKTIDKEAKSGKWILAWRHNGLQWEPPLVVRYSDHPRDKQYPWLITWQLEDQAYADGHFDLYQEIEFPEEIPQ